MKVPSASPASGTPSASTALAPGSPGRPSIDPAAVPGEHARKRQVRLPADVEARLEGVAAAQGRSASAVLRDALTDYLRRQPS